MKKDSLYSLTWRKKNLVKYRESQRKYRQTPQYKEYRKKYRESHRKEFAQKQGERYIKKRQKALDVKHKKLETLKTITLQRKELSNDEKMALIAGLVLGEGTLALHQNKGTLHPRIMIANTELELLDLAQKTLGGTYTIFSRKENRKTCYLLNISRKDAIFNALIKLHPYLLGKKRQIAELLMEWIISRSCRIVVGKELITPKEYALFEEIRKLNRRGRQL